MRKSDRVNKSDDRKGEIQNKECKYMTNYEVMVNVGKYLLLKNNEQKISTPNLEIR